MAADGTITLATKVDTKGIKNSENTVKSAAKSMSAEFGKMSQQIQAALNGGSAQSQKLALSLQKTTAQIEAQSKKVDELKAYLSALQTGKEYGTNATVNSLVKDLDTLDNKIRTMQSKLADMQALPSYKQDAAAISQTKIEIDKAIASADALGERLRSAEGAATQSEIDKTTAKLQQENVKLDELKLKAQTTGDSLRSSMTGANDSVNAITAGFDKFGNKLVGLAKRVFIFSMITAGLRSVRQMLGNALMSNEGFRQSLYQLQGALWTAFAPIYNYILPALQSLVNWITTAINAILQFVATLTGKTFASMVANGKALKQQTDAYKGVGAGGASAAKGMKKATDEAKKQIAAFDELNILSQDKADADGGGGGGAGGGGGGALDGANFDLDVSPITNTLNLLMGIAGATLAAIGLILLFSGHIGWGIGFIIAGALMLGASLANVSQYDSSDIATTLAILTGVAAISMLAIGLILLFNGQIAWGAGAIIFGLGTLGISVATLMAGDPTEAAVRGLTLLGGIVAGAMIALGIILIYLNSPGWGIAAIIIGLMAAGASVAAIVKWGGDDVVSVITMIQGIVGGALLALGIILCIFSGPNPLSIGLLIAGALTLMIAGAQIVTNKMSNEVKKQITLITTIVSAALLVLGIILIFTPVSWGLALGLIAAGAIGLASVAALNWDAIKTKVSEIFNKVLNIAKTWGLLILGIMLTLSGVAFPLGIALMKKGGANLTEAQDPVWTAIVDKVREIWGSIKEFWNANIAKWFKAETWQNLASKVGTGLQNGFKAAINGVIAIVERGINFIISKLNTLKFTIPDVVPGIGGKQFGISLNSVSIPRLAQGAVLPPNKPFLAMVGDQKNGTNIETPLETMIEAFTIAQDSRNENNGPIIVQLMLSERELGRAVIYTGTQELRRTKGAGYATKVVFG